MTAYKRIPAEKFGITPSMSGASNDLAARRAYADLDDNTLITFRAERYPVDKGLIIERGGNVGAQGVACSAPGVLDGTVFEHTSTTDGTPYVGQCWRIGRITAVDPKLQPSGLLLKDFAVVDKNRKPFDYVGHLPASIEIYFTEGVVVDGVGLVDSKGNSAGNVLGMGRTNFETYTKSCTIKNGWGLGTESGGKIQGDWWNIGGVEHYELLNNRLLRGGVLRSFFEGGTGCKSFRAIGNYINMAGEGLAAFGSQTVLESGTYQRNHVIDWSNASSAIQFMPDRIESGGGDVMPVRGIDLSRNFFSSKTSGLAAIGFGVPEIFDHEHNDNIFRCMLPYYIGATPRGRVSLHDATALDAQLFCAVSAQAELPTTYFDVATNTMHSPNAGARWLDRPDFAQAPNLRYLDTNTLIVDAIATRRLVDRRKILRQHAAATARLRERQIEKAERLAYTLRYAA